MPDDRQFEIKITGDASSLVAATEKAEAALGQTSKAVTKHGAGLQALHKLFHSLNEVVPGLGVLMQAAFSPIGAAISLAVMGLRLFHDHMKLVDEEFRKLAEEAAKPATKRMEAWGEAIVTVTKEMNHLYTALADVARAQRTAKESTEQTSAAFRDQFRAAATLADAEKENELSRLEDRHTAGLASEEQYAVQRLDIEQRFLQRKRDLIEGGEMLELLIRRRALENAELAQAGLKAVAEGGLLKKATALEDLAALGQRPSAEEVQKQWRALQDFEEKYEYGLKGFETYKAGGPREAGFSPELYDKWVTLRGAALGTQKTFQQFPTEQGRRQVAADLATDEAARAEKAAVENQRFITETGREMGERRTQFDIHHRANVELGALQQDTTLRQAVTRARENVKSDEQAVISAMEHSTGFSAEALRRIIEHGKTLADLERRLRQTEGRPPRL